MNVQQKSKGFTIIEVVLVLAIAGLIFLIVFLALPALQRNQRDTQRRADVGRTLAAVQNFQSNNNGALPLAANLNGSFKTDYLLVGGDAYADPSGTAYTVGTGTAANGTTAVPANTINVYLGFICSGETAVAGNARNVAVRVDLEGAGSYCSNNR